MRGALMISNQRDTLTYCMFTYRKQVSTVLNILPQLFTLCLQVWFLHLSMFMDTYVQCLVMLSNEFDSLFVLWWKKQPNPKSHWTPSPAFPIMQLSDIWVKPHTWWPRWLHYQSYEVILQSHKTILKKAVFTGRAVDSLGGLSWPLCEKTFESPQINQHSFMTINQQNLSLHIWRS